MAPGSANIKTWGDLGPGRRMGDAADHALQPQYNFRELMSIFGKRLFTVGITKQSVKQEPGSEAVVKSVAGDKFGIGYSGIGYKTDGVRAVPLASYYGGTCYEASAEPTLSGKYPIARYLYVYLNKKPNQPLDPLRAEFIKYILSKDGQEQTEKGGFYPITNEIRENELKKLGNLDSAVVILLLKSLTCALIRLPLFLVGRGHRLLLHGILKIAQLWMTATTIIHQKLDQRPYGINVCAIDN